MAIWDCQPPGPLLGSQPGLILKCHLLAWPPHAWAWEHACYAERVGQPSRLEEECPAQGQRALRSPGEAWVVPWGCGGKEEERKQIQLACPGPWHHTPGGSPPRPSLFTRSPEPAEAGRRSAGEKTSAMQISQDTEIRVPAVPLLIHFLLIYMGKQ